MSANAFTTLPWPLENCHRQEMLCALARRVHGLEGTHTTVLAEVVTWYESESFLHSTDTTKYIALIGEGIRFVNNGFGRSEIEQFISEKVGTMRFSSADGLEYARIELQTNIRAQLLLRASRRTMPDCTIPAALLYHFRDLNTPGAEDLGRESVESAEIRNVQD